MTKCGHLYCWPCLKKWLAQKNQCPMCNGAVNASTPGDIVPIYGTSALGEGEGQQQRKHEFTVDQQRVGDDEARGARNTDDPQVGDGDRPRGNRENPPPQAPRQGANWVNGGIGGGAFFLSPGVFGVGFDHGLFQLVVYLIVAYSLWHLFLKLQRIYHNRRNGPRAANINVNGVPGHDDNNNHPPGPPPHNAPPQVPKARPIDWATYNWIVIAVALVIITIFTAVITDDYDENIVEEVAPPPPRRRERRLPGDPFERTPPRQRQEASW